MTEGAGNALLALAPRRQNSLLDMVDPVTALWHGLPEVGGGNALRAVALTNPGVNVREAEVLAGHPVAPGTQNALMRFADLMTGFAGSANPIAARPMHRLPVDILIDPSKAGRIEILPNGRIVQYDPWRSYEPLADADRIRKELSRMFHPVEEGVFYRLTNNRSEPRLAAAGQLRPSINHADRLAERGVSVATNPYYTMHGYRYGYRLTGDLVGQGSDGEPLLNPKTIRVLSPLRSAEELVKAYEEWLLPAQRAALARLGWTEDQYRAALVHGFSPSWADQ